MFPLFYWMYLTKFPINMPVDMPIERDMNLPWSQITFPIAGDVNLPWANINFQLPFSEIDNQMPLSGAVNQDISTDWDVGGTQELNNALYKEAGPWGLQLTTVMDAMNEMWSQLTDEKAGSPGAQTALAPENNETMAKFKALHEKVQQVHEDHHNKHKAQTRHQIETLMRLDPDAAKDLLQSYLAKVNGGDSADTTPAQLPPPGKTS